MASILAAHENADPTVNAAPPMKAYWLVIVLCGSSLLASCGSSGSTTAPSNGVPVIGGLSPSTVIAGADLRSLLIFDGGLSFAHTATVTLNGAPRPGQVQPSPAGPNFIDMPLTAADLATPGCNTVTVTNPAPGGGTSNSATFVVSSASAPIFVTDTDNHRVQMFDNNGNYVGQFSHSFDLPTGIAVDCNGNVYVMDGNTHCVVDKFDSNGNFLLQFGQCAGNEGPGTFDNAGRVATDAAGNVWVTSPDYYYMQTYDSSGQFKSIICMADTGVPDCPISTPMNVQPQAITIDPVGNIYLVNVDPVTGPTLLMFDSTGKYLMPLSTIGQLIDSTSIEIAFSPSFNATGIGELYVTNSGNNRVEIFDTVGINAFRFGSQGTGNGQFEGPTGIAFDAAGDIFVTDVGNNRIEEFDIDGNYLSQFGTLGSGNGQFAAPYGIAIVP